MSNFVDLARLAELEKQLLEQREENNGLKEENTELQEENTELQEENEKIKSEIDAIKVAEDENQTEDQTDNSNETNGRQFVQYFSNKVEQIPVSKLTPYERHSFKPLAEKALEELKSDIERLGMHEPVLVREKPDGNYEIIAGHNRKLIAEMLGIGTLPCRKANKSVTDELADEIMVATNLNRKNTFAHSELAKSIAILRESRSRQGFRSDLAENPEGSIEEEFGITRSQSRRYLRIAKLVPKLLEMVDEKTLPLNAGVELSYLSQEHQAELLDIIRENNLSVSLEAARKIRKHFENKNSFDHKIIISFLEAKETDPKNTKKKKISINLNKYDKCFKDKSDGEINKIIEAALDMYLKGNNE
ncbi:MAG: ParB N-terminal domain-containing protein [Eubacterium sp.]|jgi:ParB family chromosome partitioning protein|nr:ParB N-terminal domain-containing protein [Eubacterium sp.]